MVLSDEHDRKEEGGRLPVPSGDTCRSHSMFSAEWLFLNFNNKNTHTCSDLPPHSTRRRSGRGLNKVFLPCEAL